MQTARIGLGFGISEAIAGKSLRDQDGGHSFAYVHKLERRPAVSVGRRGPPPVIHRASATRGTDYGGSDNERGRNIQYDNMPFTEPKNGRG